MEKAEIVTVVVAVLFLMGCAVESVPLEMGGYSGGGGKSSNSVSSGSRSWDDWDDYCDPSDDFCDNYSRRSRRRKIKSICHSDDYSRSGGKSNSSDSVSRGSQRDDNDALACFAIFSLIIVSVGIFILIGSTETVLKLQVVLKGPTHTIQRELDLISQIADASTKKGLWFMLSETSSRLLLRRDRCFSAHSSANKKLSFMGTAKKCFDQISAEERKKIDDATVLHVCNIREMSDSSERMDRSNNEFIVVTIVVAALGTHKLPDINCHSELENTLRFLKSIKRENIAAVKVLWTPPDKDAMQSEKKLFEDYALLACMRYYTN